MVVVAVVVVVVVLRMSSTVFFSAVVGELHCMTSGKTPPRGRAAPRAATRPPTGTAHHCSWVVRARLGAAPARHFKMLTARATTRVPTTREMAYSAIIMSFIQGLTAETSVGLKAVAVAKAKWK